MLTTVQILFSGLGSLIVALALYHLLIKKVYQDNPPVAAFLLVMFFFAFLFWDVANRLLGAVSADPAATMLPAIGLGFGSAVIQFTVSILVAVSIYYCLFKNIFIENHSARAMASALVFFLSFLMGCLAIMFDGLPRGV
jgi:hypothetical protein